MHSSWIRSLVSRTNGVQKHFGRQVLKGSGGGHVEHPATLLGYRGYIALHQGIIFTYNTIDCKGFGDDQVNMEHSTLVQKPFKKELTAPPRPYLSTPCHLEHDEVNVNEVNRGGNFVIRRMLWL